jgi:predicted transcriptional regulator
MMQAETREDRRREWREMLRRLRVTQDEIAERLGIGRSAVSNVVRYGEVPEYWWYLAMEIARERIAALPEEAVS